jgi:Endonuclease/Exonuclease/phosphatase family
VKARIATWNLEWAVPGAKVEKRILTILESLDADVLVLTEASIETVPGFGYVVSPTDSWGYPPRHQSFRKVLMWSKQPWEGVRSSGPASMPPGRFVSGKTMTELGPIEVVGVCIPWKDAHVRTGDKNRMPWQDHQLYLRALRNEFNQMDGPVVIAGDFNQRIPRRLAPVEVFEELTRTLKFFEIPTQSSGPDALIDHVAHSTDFSGKLVQVLPKSDAFGQLTDHIGAVVEMERQVVR